MVASAAAMAIAGHAGVGHTHCPGGLIQDDTAGFAVAGALIRDFLKADTRVRSVDVDVDRNTIQVTTLDGGVGESSPRRGITPAEADLMQSAVHRDALLCQTVAVQTLGRMYGQGVLETPVCLAAALANASLDTFRKKAPKSFHLTVESAPTNSGYIGGMRLDLNAIPVSVLATVNACTSGIGPNEDLEGNVALGSKRDLMTLLGMMRCPTIVLEGKAYSPAFSDSLARPTFLIRANRDLDNVVVAEALYESARSLNYPVIYRDDVFPREEGTLRRKGVEVADAIIHAAERLKAAETGPEKVRVVAELATLVSQECGGMSFMTNKVHDVVRQVGMIPGTSAVLSLLVTRDYLTRWKIPLLDDDDIRMMQNIVRGALPLLHVRLPEARRIVEHRYQDLGPLEFSGE